MKDIKRVLIVDDHQHICKSLTSCLTTILPHSEIMEAHNGRYALYLTAATSPDLIFMGIAIPIMDGLETTRRIKRQWPALKIIILTVEGGQQQEALKAGADAFLIKGVTSDQLQGTIHALYPDTINVNLSAPDRFLATILGWNCVVLKPVRS